MDNETTILIHFIIGTAKYKKPIIRFKNIFSGKYLTAENNELVQKADTGGTDQQW